MWSWRLAGDVDPIALDRPYYLGVQGAGARPYRLLRDAMADSGQVGVARMALRGRERLVVLRVRDEVIVAQQLLWPDEIRSAQGLVEPAPEPQRQELPQLKATSDEGWCLEHRDRDRATGIHSLLAAALVEYSSTLATCIDERLTLSGSW